MYHYCSTEVFEKIIVNKKLRLSDITKSNDFQEIVWTSKHILDMFLRNYNESKCIKLEKPYSKEDFKKLLEASFEDYFESGLYSFPTCCFSEDGDLLSQWRGYADDASGFSIGFNKNALLNLGVFSGSDICNTNTIAFGKITYEDNMYFVDQSAKDCLKDLKREKSIDGNKSDLLPKQKTIIDKWMLTLLRSALYVKNPFFKEEKEWRLTYCWNTNSCPKNVQITNNLLLTKIDFYVRENNIVPYVDLDFSRQEHFVKEIIIGPKCKVTKENIKYFLKLNGIGDCEVKKSIGTYR